MTHFALREATLYFEQTKWQTSKLTSNYHMKITFEKSRKSGELKFRLVLFIAFNFQPNLTQPFPDQNPAMSPFSR